MNRVAIEHWLLPVVRHAGLPGAQRLSIPADTDTIDAWNLVLMSTRLPSELLLTVVAEHFGLERANITPEALHFASLLPAEVARRRNVLTVGCDDETVTIATSDPVALDAEREVAQLTARQVRVVLATPDEMAHALDTAYPVKPPVPKHEVGVIRGEDLAPRVLVVEDEAVTRLMIRRLLQARGYRVMEAANAAEAMELLERTEAFQLVTLDLGLGEGKNGLEVLRHIRSRVRTADVPVVVATAIDQPGVEMELFEAGADDFVVKPLDGPRFLLRLAAVLRRYGVVAPAPVRSAV